jgi:hypothetical protein
MSRGGFRGPTEFMIVGTVLGVVSLALLAFGMPFSALGTAVIGGVFLALDLAVTRRSDRSGGEK